MVPPLWLRDEDLAIFNDTSFGANSAGSWELYFDGSDVGLSTNGLEDVWAASLDAGNIYLATRGDFAVPNVSGDAATVFTCAPSSTGATTTCTHSTFWEGTLNGFAGENVDGIFLTP